MVTQTDIILKELSDFSADLMKRLTVEVTANLIEGTPVDTGWARANWVPRIGEPLTEVVSSPESVSAGAQERGLAEVITQYNINRGSIYISNNVPYIVNLNDGSSLQAPRAFVQTSISRAIAKVIS